MDSITQPSSLESFIAKSGILTMESLIGYARAFVEQESDTVRDFPGFPFLYTQEYLTFPASPDRLYPTGEVARDDTYIYYETLGNDSETFHFSELVRELEEKCRVGQ